MVATPLIRILLLSLVLVLLIVPSAGARASVLTEVKSTTAQEGATPPPEGQEPDEQEATDSGRATPQETEADPAQIREPETTPDGEEFRVEIHGRLKADASLDTALVDPGNFARWVESPELGQDQNHFNLTVRESRLGLDVTAPGEGGPAISGHFEIDFYGGGPENRNVVQLRHAHIDIDWDSGWSLIGGQFSDVISPLVPTTINYSVAWWAGNIGYRRPQFRGTKRFGDDTGLIVSASISRTIGDAFAETAADTGVDSGRPSLQARIGYEWGRNGRPGAIGISGHEGTETLGRDEEGNEADLRSWSVGADLMIPIANRWLLKGEAWTGENLDDYLGGIGQGVNLRRQTIVRSTGGWASIEFRPNTTHLFSIGAGIDDPKDADLDVENVQVRTYNHAIWGNVLVDLGRGLSAGFEISSWRTDHGLRESGTAFRFQTAVIFAF